MPERIQKLTDPRALRAVAHPTRLKLLGLLRREGPLTATEAGERIGESPASCSFHLRQLAKWGLVEEAGGGRGRQRPWRATAGGHEWSPRGASAESTEAGDMLSRVAVDGWFEQALDWVERRREDDDEWVEAAHFGDQTLYVTPAELNELNRQVAELLEPFARRVGEREARPAGSRAVTFIQLDFPLDDSSPPR